MNEHEMEKAIKTVESRVEKLETHSEEIDIVIGGEQLTGKPGILQNQLRMITALFEAHEGVVPRLTAMERRELERIGWVKGAWAVWCVLGVIIGWLVNKYIFN